MKLTKKLEAEILKAYNHMWKAYLNGDIKTFASCLHKDFKVIGTAEKEVFSNKKKAVKFYTDTAEQITGLVQMRNRNIKLMPVGSNVLITEYCDAYVLIEKKWTFYGPIRLTTLLTKSSGKWQNLNQHGSLPDSRTDEGEQLAIKKIEKENLQLKEAVNRRTVELQQKNHELEIETALEKVRTVAMGMKHPADMLDICKMIALQLQSLGINKIRNVQTAIFYEDKETYMNYEYYAKHDKTIITETSYTNHQIHIDFAAQMLKGKGEFFTTQIKGKKKLSDWIAYQKTTNVFIDPLIETAKSLTYYWHSLGPVALGTSTYEPLTDNEKNVFKRFLNVFELSYRRYLDIEKAEAQAREAQIEAALERVRSRAMAMQTSKDLNALISHLFNECTRLDIVLDRCLVMIVDPKTLDTIWVLSNPETPEEPSNHLVKYHEYHPYLAYIDAWKKRAEKWHYILEGAEKKEWDQFIFQQTELSKLPVPVKEGMQAIKSIRLNCSFGNFGSITLSSYVPLTEPQEDILTRFTKVFDLTYTRFNDLKQAEAQAREAQIEAALERVRSRSMGMHKSNDLHEVIKIVTEQLTGLGLKFNVSNFAKVYTEGSWDLWVSSPEQSYPALIHVPNLDHPIFNNVREITAKGIDFFTDVYTQDEKNIFFRHFFENSEAKYAPEERKQFVYNTKGFARSLFLTKNIWFSVSRYDTTPFTDEENAIFKRFANVFEQAYTRFLDLQKAEVQSREAQIQLALERVRARTMAMHKSDELQEVIQVLSQQFLTLGFKIGAATFALNYRDSNDFNLWLSVPDANYITRVHIPYFDHPLFHNFIDAKEKGRDFIVQHLSFEEKNSYFRHFFANAPGSSEEEMKAVYNSKGYAGSEVLMQSISLGIANLDGIPYIEEENVILKRFASAFEQSYIRFTDLQKAEAQVREAEIELALERVRARTMAMHHSSELSEAATLVFEQLNQLGAVLWSCGFTICKSDSDIVERWMSQPNGKMLEPMQIPLSSSWGEQLMYDAWKNQTELFTYVAEGKELAEGFENLKSHSSTQIIYQRLMEIGIAFPTWMKHFVVPFKQGYLWIMALKPFEETQIFIRFTRVFEQTYTRFLDLQKAEAQAREAQIEAALERVRSKAMAMHKSDDLNMAATTVFEELDKLNLGTLRCGIGIVNKEKKTAEVWTATKSDAGTIVQVAGDESMDIHPLLQGAFESWLKQEEFAYELRDEDLVNYYRALDDTNFNLPADVQTIPDKSGGLVQYFFTINFGAGGLFSFRATPYPEESKKVLRRFASVFNLTYQRFQDIQKAEAQAREAQIEAALEKIRSRSLAMHRSDELKEVITVMFEKLNELKVTLGTVAIWLFDIQSMNSIFWVANNLQQPDKVNLPYDEQLMKEDTNYRDSWQAWLSGRDYINKEYNREQKNRYFEYVFAHNDLVTIPPPAREFILNGESCIASLIVEKNSALFFDCWSGQVYDEARINVFRRAAKVFEQAYIRFLDLQKAEAQAREAQIEAALERVRSRSMAMHKSDELREVVSVLYEQLQQLNFAEGAATITIMHADSGDMDWWMSGFGNSKYPESYQVKNFDHPFHQAQLEAWKKGETFAAIDVEGASKKVYDEVMFYQTDFRKLPEETKLIMTSLPKVTFSLAFIKYGALSWGPLPTGREQSLILQRFAKVFEQSYTRFLDLQKAEAQAKEALIDAALERVRSRTMAMHNTQDVGNTIVTMFDELVKLDVQTDRCGILIGTDSQYMEVWTAKSNTSGEATLIIGKLDTTTHPLLTGGYNGWKNKEKSYTYELKGEDLKNYYQVINNANYYPAKFDTATLPARQTHSEFYFPDGAIFSFTPEPLSEDAIKILKRFAGVFALTYRRYLDLQKAEAQSKEATIEAALEKVRGRAMAMHNSSDLSAAASLVFTELRKLGIIPIRCGVGVLNKESRKGQLYSATSSEASDSLSLIGWVMLEGHPVMENIYDSWVNQYEYYPELSGEELRSYYGNLLSGLSVPVSQFKDDEKQYGHFLPFSSGCLYAWSNHHYNDEELKILKRFAAIIDLTFRRYLDLQKTEASAREAIKQAALDRVRADIASMRTVSDLDRITPLIWNELNVLGIPFVRCGVFIMDDSQQQVHTFLSTPDGKAIAAFHLPYNTPGSFSEVVSYWQQKKIYITHWDQNDFLPLADTLLQQGAVKTKEQYLGSIPVEGIYLHFLPFLQGMLYAGNTVKLNDDQVALIQSVADAFSTAYARYEDFNKLEAAKQQVEKTLVDLKQAQTQLVQAEKMASLGQLTAGIAHEIQNPLNFVNNFSEVSEELIKEMIDEANKGNIEEVKAIADDLVQNLGKIYHHGKRADSIVKGMLEHSRTSTGNMEPTDINALADEYLRLSYHGIRAKDKSFNTAIHTDFDNTIDKINVIGQDIGRVLLNLYNNAFYAVNEKKKQSPGGYEPAVSVSTRKSGDMVLISVKDNGNGISQTIVDKIFQPFFTTKPTGSGTGLGLSLAYDIIKAHGGDIKVNTKENQGSEFVITLPC